MINGATPAASRTPATTPMMQTADMNASLVEIQKSVGTTWNLARPRPSAPVHSRAACMKSRAGRMPSLPNSPSSCTTIDENAHT